jgi:hypothetical protein
LGLHLLISGFFPPQQQRAPQERIITERISVSKRKPVPKIIAHVKPAPRAYHTIVPRIVIYHPAPKAVAPIHKRHGGKASPHKHLVRIIPHATPRPISLAQNKSIGVTNGGAGPANGLNEGIGGEAGSDTGQQGKGRSNAADSATAPCGFVEFKPIQQEMRKGQEVVWVQIIVHLRNGEILIDDLHWPFVYAGDADNPWSARNLRNPNFQTTMQLPPPDFNLEAEQESATVLAVRQTGPDGFTLLEPCPEQAAR